MSLHSGSHVFTRGHARASGLSSADPEQSAARCKQAQHANARHTRALHYSLRSPCPVISCGPTQSRQPWYAHCVQGTRRPSVLSQKLSLVHREPTAYRSSVKASQSVLQQNYLRKHSDLLFSVLHPAIHRQSQHGGDAIIAASCITTAARI